jgi:hypothetical protein
MEKIEYRVRSVTRYVVTRFHESVGEGTGSSSVVGEYGNTDIAYSVAYALCKEEHNRLGYPLGDERIVYPKVIYGHLNCCGRLAELEEAWKALMADPEFNDAAKYKEVREKALETINRIGRQRSQA